MNHAARWLLASSGGIAPALRSGAIVTLLALAAVGCGDDDDHASKPDGSVGGSGGSGSHMDGGSGKGGTGGSTMTGGGTGGSTVGGTGGMGLPMAMCDTTIPTTATCGGTACPAATSPIAAFVCSVPCCLPDNTCGLRRAYMDAPTECSGPAVPDPSCPAMATMGIPMMAAPDAGAGMSLPGCCAPSGFCGVITATDMSCITSSPLLPNLMPGMPCGMDMDGGVDDAGH